MPIKKFLQGEVLTADEVNQYLMDQAVTVFADVTARDNAFGGAGEPVLTEGRLCYLQSTNAVQFYDGSQWQDAPSFGLGSDSVTTIKILDANVTTAKIAALAVTAAKLASDAVTTAKILDANVTAAKLASDSVTTVKILDANVTTAKILDANVTAAKLASDSVTTVKILDANVTAAKLASGAAVSNVGFTPAPSELTLNAQVGTTYTLVLSDSSKFVTCSNASAVVVTVPPNSSVAFPTGTQVNIMMLGVGSTSISPGSGVTISSSGNKYTLNAQYAVTTLLKIDTNTWVAIGNLKA